MFEINHLTNSINYAGTLKLISNGGIQIPIQETQTSLEPSGTLVTFNTSPVHPDYNGTMHFKKNNEWISLATKADSDELNQYVSNLVDNAAQELNDSINETISTNGKLPKGLIIIFNGTANDVPTGWAVCDGQTVNGVKTPDLRDRFIVGSSSTNTNGVDLGSDPIKKTNFVINDTGGEWMHQLTIDEIPEHQHIVPHGSNETVTTNDPNYGYPDGPYGEFSNPGTGWIDKSNYWFYLSEAGQDIPHKNAPPFRSMIYIMLVA